MFVYILFLTPEASANNSVLIYSVSTKHRYLNNNTRCAVRKQKQNTQSSFNMRFGKILKQIICLVNPL